MSVTRADLDAYTQAVRERDCKAATWLGLNIDEVLRVDIHEEKKYDVIDWVTWTGIERQQPTRGRHDMLTMSGAAEEPLQFGGTVFLPYDDGRELLEHIGPKPEFPGMNDPAFRQLRQRVLDNPPSRP